MSTPIDDLMSKLFFYGRPPRSAEYKAGVRAMLELRMNGAPLICPFAQGSTQFDAFYSGADEGSAVWRRMADEAAQ